MKITVQQAKGNERFPRYILALENGCYYDGHGWTPIEKQAIKYASLPIIKAEWKKLQEELKSGMIELVGTYVVRLTGIKDITAEQVQALAWYMSAASTFTLDYSTPRPAGLEDTNIAISTQLRWCDLRLKK